MYRESSQSVVLAIMRFWKIYHNSAYIIIEIVQLFGRFLLVFAYNGFRIIYLVWVFRGTIFYTIRGPSVHTQQLTIHYYVINTKVGTMDSCYILSSYEFNSSVFPSNIYYYLPTKRLRATFHNVKIKKNILQILCLAGFELTTNSRSHNSCDFKLSTMEASWDLDHTLRL